MQILESGVFKDSATGTRIAHDTFTVSKASKELVELLLKPANTARFSNKHRCYHTAPNNSILVARINTGKMAVYIRGFWYQLVPYKNGHVFERVSPKWWLPGESDIVLHETILSELFKWFHFRFSGTQLLITGPYSGTIFIYKANKNPIFVNTLLDMPGVTILQQGTVQSRDYYAVYRP